MTVLIPNHCSSLLGIVSSASNNGISTQGDSHDCVHLFVHRERAVWNVFYPILSMKDASSVTSKKLIILLLRNLKKLTQYAQIDIASTTLKCNDLRNQDQIDSKTDATPKWTVSTYLIKQTIHSHHNTKNDRRYHLSIYILPPFSPFISRKYAMQPERTFSSSLVRLENLQIQLQSLNAYIATLGGGYFLCHYLSTAVSLARYQRRIALQMNDVELAMKCTINEAYNYIHAGKIMEALSLIGETKKMAKERIQSRPHLCNDIEKDVIVSMCNAAEWFAFQVQNEMMIRTTRKKGQERCNPKRSHPNGPISLTHDDFQRIRVVRVRPISNNVKVL